jgi:hypothetical protein
MRFLLKNKKRRKFLLIFVYYEKILLVHSFQEGISIKPAEPPYGFVTPARIFRRLKVTAKVHPDQ